MVCYQVEHKLLKGIEMQVNKTLYLVFMISFLTSGLYAQNNKYTAKESIYINVLLNVME